MAKNGFKKLFHERYGHSHEEELEAFLASFLAGNYSVKPSDPTNLVFDFFDTYFSILDEEPQKNQTIDTVSSNI